MVDQASSNSSKPGTFFSLPFEIRTLIYQKLFADSTLRAADTPLPHPVWDYTYSHHPILLTCKQCHEEAKALYYSFTVVELIDLVGLYAFLAGREKTLHFESVRNVKVPHWLYFCIAAKAKLPPSLESITISLTTCLEADESLLDQVKRMVSENMPAWAADYDQRPNGLDVFVDFMFVPTKVGALQHGQSSRTIQVENLQEARGRSPTVKLLS